MEKTDEPQMQPLHLETPLLKSLILSEKTGMDIWLKLENTQNTQSYKIRGVGRLCQKAVQNGCKHIVSSSGGNAGMAAAYAAKLLNVPCTVVVPETTQKFMIDKIRRLATTVEVFGQAWDEANTRALEIAKEKDHVLIHPFDHPDLWDGHSTIVDEIVCQMQKLGKKPDVAVLSVGGGGLFCGLVQGLKKHGLADIPIVAMGTEGAASFNTCIVTKQHVMLKEITSIARTLGCKRICDQAYDYISEYKHITSRVVTDKQAVEACLHFADDHLFLVSPSAGSTLAAAYSGILEGLQKDGHLPSGRLQVVIIVCGGNEVSFEEIKRWRHLFDL